MNGINIILGHLIGDYVLQNDWMALNKKKKGRIGLLSCIIHCLIWSISILLFVEMNGNKIIIFSLLFLSHFILDRFNFVKWYVSKLMRHNPAIWKIYVVDNTLHLLMVYFISLYFK